MGSCHSRIHREEMVSRCKARKRYTKQFVKARQAFAVSHALYLRSLRTTGAALLQFAIAEATRHHDHPPPPAPSSDTWTTSSFTASPVPPPPPPQSSQWDFWCSFVPQTCTATEEEWEATTAGPVAPPSSGDSGFSKGIGSSNELSLVVSRNSVKDLVGIIRDLDEYFLRAADSGNELSLLLEVPSQMKEGRVYDTECNLSLAIWNLGCSSQRFNNIAQSTDHKLLGSNLASHCSTVERLFAWEKKLYQEVKNAGLMKMEHEKKVEQLKKLDLKRADCVKTKQEVEKLESQMTVASKAIESTSFEITQLRENQLYSQLLDIVKGLMSMWRSMYECHQAQTHIVQQLKNLNPIPSMDPTTDFHRQSTLALEHEIHQWLLSFSNLVASQRDYLHSLTGWLRLSLFQFNPNSPSSPLAVNHDSKIYSLCEDWSQAVDRIPGSVASDGIKSLLNVIHGIVVQQEEEHKQQKKSDLVFKELEKRNYELRSVESKCQASGSEKTVVEKRAKVSCLRSRAEEEKSKQDKSVRLTRSTTLDNLQMGLPNVFEAIVGFSSVCMSAFESVYNRAKDTNPVG